MTVKNATHNYEVIRSTSDGLNLVEVYPVEGERPVHRFYIVSYDENANQVRSILRKDNPPADSGGGQWYANGFRPSSVAHVANPMTRQTALRHWRKLVNS